ncbi:hypothetical protein PG985_010927 [Apiospora marii]|uniref:8-oxo-dGTP diphosphatase n=1 Tax=Apiospora marii TaxID=335849 RepID=A0ABR1T2D5_9PEZI
MEVTIKQDILHLMKSREEFLAEINKANNVQFDKLTVGAAILQSDGRILLLKRRPDEKHFPNVFEMPGGKVEETDLTIGQAIAREVLEESNLTVTAVLEPLSPFTYTTVSGAGITRNVVQLSYIVQVEATEFRVNPEEHTEGVWADNEMVDKLDITNDMKDLIVEALAMEL